MLISNSMQNLIINKISCSASEFGLVLICYAIIDNYINKELLSFSSKKQKQNLSIVINICLKVNICLKFVNKNF